MKHSLRIKNILYNLKLMHLFQFFSQKNSVAIFRYHAIVEPEKNYYASSSISISPELFEEHIQFFSKHYNIISLDTVFNYSHEGKPFPKNAAVLTFDDGYQDNFSASEIMKKYGVTGTFYIAAKCLRPSDEYLWLFEVIYLLTKTENPHVTIKTNGVDLNFPLNSLHQKRKVIKKITEVIKSNDLINREEIRFQLKQQIVDVPDFNQKASDLMLSREQVKQMSDNGMTIGGHTMTHLNLPNAKPDDAWQEITECKRLLSEITGKEVHHFSYPNGGNYDYYNPQIMNMVKEAGYLTATTSNNGLAYRGDNLLELKRIRITNHLAEVQYQVACEPIIKMFAGQ